MDIKLNDRLIELDSEKSRLEDELKKIQNEIDQVREAVVKQFLAESTQSWKRTDGVQIYLRRTLYANVQQGVEPEVVCSALRSGGLGFLVKARPDTAGLKTWIKEQEDERGGPDPNGVESVLPPVVRPFFSIFEKITPTVRGNTNGGSEESKEATPASRGE